MIAFRTSFQSIYTARGFVKLYPSGWVLWQVLQIRSRVMCLRVSRFHTVSHSG